MTFSVTLDAFEGPLDLLLSLVSKDRVDVVDISISQITEEYLAAVKAMGEIDLETASAFLVMAATLLELKSMKLLPRRIAEDPELAALLEERDRLLHRLIEYSTFKSASARLSQTLEELSGFLTRIPSIPPELAPAMPDILEGMTLDKLVAAAKSALSPKPDPIVDVSHVTPIRVTVGEMVELLAEQLRTERTTRFGQLCGIGLARIEVIVRFLALLELFKSQSVDLEQAQPFDDIVIRWREPRRGGNQ